MKYYIFLRKDWKFATLQASEAEGDEMGWQDILNAMPIGTKPDDVKEVLVSVDNGDTWVSIYRNGVGHK